MPRFQLMDDIQLQDLIDSADSKNTKYAVKYGIKIFEEFLRNVNTDLGDVNRLPNADLDKILQKFYAGCRQKNGDYYSKKSMLTIRFGLQRHFLNYCSCKRVWYSLFYWSTACWISYCTQVIVGVNIHDFKEMET